jgi:menaquinone-dependent protoporphyrinogen IX oxidase
VERKRITCPETAHLEEVDLESTPLGILVAGCSRFEPRCDVQCARECARRMDHRDRRDVDDREERVLVVYADAKRTRPVATALAEELSQEGVTVEQAAAELGAPPPADYDAVVVGTSVRFGRFPRPLRAYLAEHRAGLAEIPTFLYVVDRRDELDAKLAHATGWQPTFAISIARPPLRVRWFGDPMARREQRVHELAQAVIDELPTA